MKSQFDARFLMADTANGVVEIDMVDYPEEDYLHFEAFRDALPDLEDGEVVFGMVAPEHFEQLHSEYGIH
ncbi:MAG: hypothetical protein RR390_00615 [Hafnia sp.]